MLGMNQYAKNESSEILICATGGVEGRQLCREAQILYVNSFTGIRNLGLDEQVHVWIVE